MRREMEREFQDVLKGIQAKAPKNLVREYEAKEGEKGKERTICLRLFYDGRTRWKT